LRALLDEGGMDASEFVERVQAAGVDVTSEAVKKWISGDSVPRAQDLERIGHALGLKDYRRQLLPPPVSRKGN
jgi:hypothetical protein